MNQHRLSCHFLLFDIPPLCISSSVMLISFVSAMSSNEKQKLLITLDILSKTDLSINPGDEMFCTCVFGCLVNI